MTRRRRHLIACVGLVVLAAAFVLGSGWWLAQPWRPSPSAPPADLPIEPIRIDSASGSRLAAWFLRGSDERGALLVLHGVHSSKATMVPRARFLWHAGYSVLLVDFQAQGESPGEHVTFGGLEARDVEACLAFLARRLPGRPLGAIGVSMGGAALVLSHHPLPLKALVLESVYPTIDDATRDRLRRFFGPPGGWCTPLLLMQLHMWTGVSPAELRPIDAIATIGCPLLLLHGTKDRFTLYPEATTLYATARDPKQFWAVEGAQHEDLHAFVPQEYERRVLAFLATWMR